MLKIEPIDDSSKGTSQGLFKIFELKATISDVPAAFTNQTGVTLTISGDEITHYKHKLDTDAYGIETPVSTPISLTGLDEGSHTIFVIGKDAYGNWQPEDNATTATWTIDTTKPTITGLSDDTSPIQSKIWTWDADEEATFRYTIDKIKTWTPVGNFSAAKTATKSEADGIWYLHVQAQDLAENESDVTSVYAIIDKTGPTINATPSGGLFNALQNVALFANETVAIYYTTDGSSPILDSPQYTSAIDIIDTTTLKFFAIDTAGNTSTVYTETYTLDSVPPETGSVSISDNEGYTNQAKPTLNLASTGAAYMRFAFSEEGLAAATWFPFYSAYNGFDISTGGEGTKTVWVEYKELAGNIQTVHAGDSTTYDTTPPGSQIDAPGGVYDEGITVQLTSEEGSSTYYTLDGSAPTTSSIKNSNPISITTDTTLKFFAVDMAGNAEEVHTEKYVISVLSDIEMTSNTTLITGFKGTIQFTAAGVYEGVDNKDISSVVVWSSSNDKVATISETGLVTAIKSGFHSVEIGAKIGEMVSNKIVITINIPVTLESIEIFPTYLILTAPNVTADVTAIAHFSDETTEDITLPAAFSSGDPSIMSVSSTGTVTAKGYGTTTLTGMKDGVTAEVSVTVGDFDQTDIEEFIKKRGNLILVTGGGTDDALWPVSNALSDYTYKVFISRGFDGDSIYYLNPEPEHDYDQDGISDDIVDDASPTPGDIQDAISLWATPFDTQGPLYLILEDHGAYQQFLVNAEGPGGILTAALLNQWLSDFQDITGRQVVVIVEACQSGSFVDALKGPNRVIIGSAEAGENSNLNDKFSFTKFLMSSIFNGTDLKNAFGVASSKLHFLPAPWKNQIPQMDDMEEGALAKSIFVGGNFKIASAAPVISGDVEVTMAEDGKVTINATATDLEGLQEVWAIAIPPGFTTQFDVVDFTTPDLTGLPNFEMTKEEGTDVYSVSTYSIFKTGNHRVIVYALDTEGNITNSEEKIVTIVKTDSSCQIDLVEGWNLLSLCREPADNFVSTVLADIKENIASGWKWVNGTWEVYLPSMTPEEVNAYIEAKGFTQMADIYSGEGFWINSGIPQALTVFGTQPTDTSSSLKTGWNLTGLKSGVSKPTSLLVYGKEEQMVSLWKWAANTWEVYLPEYGDEITKDYADGKGFGVLSIVNPGEGFWVNCTGAITIE